MKGRLHWAPAHQELGSGEQARAEAIALTKLGLLPAHLAILANGAGLQVGMKAANRGVLGALLIGLGNVMPKLPRNGLVGIRTPWTLAGSAVWERTHRLAGYLCTAAGVVSLASLPSGGKRATRIPMAALLGAVATSAAYSFVAYARRPRSGS